MSKIHFIGDVHAHWNDLTRIVNNTTAEHIIQVGDLGVFPNLKSMPPKLSKKMLYIDGNHDHHPYLKTVVESGNLEISQNCHYIPRGTQIELDGIKINCIGGADSIDKAWRKDGRDWFKDEIPSYKEYERFALLPPSEIVLTHTAPVSVIDAMGYYETDDPVSMTLERIWESWDWKPKFWIFGHTHYHFYQMIKGTTFICVPCVHDFGNTKAYDGYIIDTDDCK